jgi:hypothetical protein
MVVAGQLVPEEVDAALLPAAAELVSVAAVLAGEVLLLFVLLQDVTVATIAMAIATPTTVFAMCFISFLPPKYSLYSHPS